MFSSSLKKPLDNEGKHFPETVAAFSYKVDIQAQKRMDFKLRRLISRILKWSAVGHSFTHEGMSLNSDKRLTLNSDHPTVSVKNFKCNCVVL